MFKGAHTALLTPFRNQQVDETALGRLIEAQVDAGIDGIVAVGTTGESPTLNHEEHLHVIHLAVQIAHKRCLVIAGTGSNSTAEAIEMTREAQDAGADAALVVAPYYNRPSQEGLFRHFKAIANSTRLPIILYSIPSRCGVEIGVETTARLAKACENIVAIKEAGGSVDRVSQLRAALPDAFDILSGDDGLTLPFLAAGAVGVISVASNLVPGAVVDLVRAHALGKNDVALGLHERWYPLFKDLFIEPNPVPVKTALALCEGYLLPDVRLPLCEMAPATFAKLRATLESLDLLKAA